MKAYSVISENKMKFKYFILTLLLSGLCVGSLFAQTSTTKHRILLDLAHKQVFWKDTTSISRMDANQAKRIIYLISELKKTAFSVNAELSFITEKIKPELLANGDLLFIHIPSTKYSSEEVSAITGFLDKGGSMFIVMDEDHWSTLKQTNVNEILKPFGLEYGTKSQDTLVGGHSKAGIITDKALKITYDNGRVIQGGTPFCFNQTEQYPFGTYMILPKGGRIIVMGDGMSSLYMTSWKGVNDYQCEEFMHDAFKWLLK